LAAARFVFIFGIIFLLFCKNRWREQSRIPPHAT
jgi:hypothetical protein